MNSTIEKLRRWGGKRRPYGEISDVCDEAINEIDRLQALVQKLLDEANEARALAERATVQAMGAAAEVERVKANAKEDLDGYLDTNRRLEAALRLREDAEDQCLEAVDHVGQYNSGDRIVEARDKVRRAFTKLEEASDGHL